MPFNQQVVIVYVLFWAVRINGCVRRWRQPLLRGPEWFFNVRVQPDFYSSAGRKILHRYWMCIFIPFAVDIPIAIAIFLSGRLVLLNWLVLGLAALIHINHLFSVDLAERQARRFALPEAEQPVASLMLSLKPRRLRDYTNPKLEIALALSAIVAMAWLVRYYVAAPEHQNWRLVFGRPALFLYFQVGLLFVKCGIVGWRTPVPQEQADEHFEAREEARKFYLRRVDWQRISTAAALFFWPVLIRISPAQLNRVFNIWFGVWVGISILLTILVEIERKKLRDLDRRARPLKLPNLLGQSESSRWPVCYQPSAPMLVLKGARGYSLNLANTLAQVGAAYVAGLIVLTALLRTGH
jgi:hypothetical protein